MRNYAVSDLHGQLWVYEKIKEKLDPDDIVICLGDCVDRGPHSWELMEKIYFDPQFIYIAGNHEEMLIYAIEEYLYDKDNHSAQELVEFNGGRDTLDAMYNMSEEDLLEWLERLKELPYILTYFSSNNHRVILSHSGFKETNPEAEDYLWSRDHFNAPWQYGEDAYMVHGHTPITSMKIKMGLSGIHTPKEGIYKYCDGHKINIDTNVCNTGWFVLFDLDTLEGEVISWLA